MRKKTDFNTAEDLRLDERAQKVLTREFALPETVKQAQRNAFDEIRMRAAENQTGSQSAKIENRNKRAKRRFLTIPRTVGSIAAAAAVFSAVCVSNPALAENIPLIGHVFEELGNSLGFSGDYGEYAKPLASVDGTADGADNSGTAEGSDSSAAAGDSDNSSAADGSENGSVAGGAAAGADSVYSKTSDGVTVTLSEIYCNEESLNLSMVITSEEAFPDTITYENGRPALTLTAHEDSTDLSFSYNPEFEFYNGFLDGRFMDEHTYAGVLRIELNETNTDEQKAQEFYEERDAFLQENGYDPDNITADVLEQIAAELGMEEYSDYGLSSVGGPDTADYFHTIEIPDTFSLDLNITEIAGRLADSQEPEMPQELMDAYEQGLADLGLKKDDFANYTDEQMEQEHQLFQEMWNQYYEMYPEAAEGYNSYNSWSLTGEWDFQVDVEIDRTETVTKEINDLDENGIGVLSVTKTPFELNVSIAEGGKLCFAAVLDANGDLMREYGNSTDTMAVQDHDVSKVDIYICDYVEYMDELKGYYWNDNIEESGYASFAELLGAKALHHTEVVFDE